MTNLKKLFFPNPCMLRVSKTEKEVLECFLDNKAEFEQWSAFQPNKRIRFRFFYPTAVDFYFDECKLYTAFFGKGATHDRELKQLKMTRVNYTSIRSGSWQPFREVIVAFLHHLEENNKVVLFRQTKVLQEYAVLCSEAPAGKTLQKKAGAWQL